MADKMGGSKCRTRGSRKDQRGVNARRKAGLPAKSGRRSLRKSVKKVKENFPLVVDVNGRKKATNTHRTVAEWEHTHRFSDRWKTGEPVMVPVLKHS